MCVMQIADLTSEYYHLVPRKGFEYERMQPICNPDLFRTEWSHLNSVMELEMASKILAGAQFRIKGASLTQTL